MNINQVRDLLRRECEKAGSARAWAQAAGLSGAYVSDVLNGRRDPADAILSALGLVKVVRYEPAPQKRRAKMEAKRGKD